MQIRSSSLFLPQVLVVAVITILTSTGIDRGKAVRVLPFKTFYVRVVNALGGRNMSLDLYCRTRIDDWGMFTINSTGYVEFEFRIDPLFLTKVSCEMSFQTGERNHFAYICAFNSRERFVKENCEGVHCIWLAKQDVVVTSLGTSKIPWGVD